MSRSRCIAATCASLLLVVLSLGAGACASGSGAAWPVLRHKLGVYGLVSQPEVSGAQALRIGAVLTLYRSSRGKVVRNARLIDKTPQYDIYRGYASGRPLAAIKRAIRADVERGFRDPLIGGFYVLDDPPRRHRNMLPALLYAHSLIQRLNRTTSVKRPAVCAFGSTLDYRVGAVGPFVAARGFLDMALQNYSPRACDVAMLYAYAMNDRPGVPVDYDWQMTALLPYFRARLTTRGFDGRRQLLVGIPQAWGETGSHVHVPSASQLASQTGAFCRGGAAGIVAFAWRMSDVNFPHASTLSNDPGLRSGLEAGYAACRRAWGAR